MADAHGVPSSEFCPRCHPETGCLVYRHAQPRSATSVGPGFGGRGGPGNLGYAIGAAVGLSAWFAFSSFAITVTKYARAAYFNYLSIRTLRVTSIQRRIPWGSISVLIAAATDTLYALATGIVSPQLPQKREWKTIGRGVSASVFLGLGFYTVFVSAHRRKSTTQRFSTRGTLLAVKFDVCVSQTPHFQTICQIDRDAGLGYC